MRINRCKYPGCRRNASETWALVPLCDVHYDAIKTETNRYYNPNNDVKYSERNSFLAIAKMIPWSRINMGDVLPDGSIRGH